MPWFQIMIALDLTLIPMVQKNIEGESNASPQVFCAQINSAVSFLVVDGNVPSVFPKCFVSNTDITTNKLIVVAPIDTIIFETSERGVGFENSD